jgi:HK97 family phage major capsid protein
MTPEEIAAEKAEALKAVTEKAQDVAQRYVADNLAKLLKTEVGSDEANKMIAEIAQKAFKSMKIKDSADDQEKALETILDEMQKQHDVLAKTIKDLQDGKASVVKSFEAELKEQVVKQEAQLKALHEKGDGKVNLTIKAAGTMLISTNYSGGVVGLSNWDTDFARVQRRQPFMRELVRVLTTDNLYIAWAEQANPDPGVAGTVAEGAAKPQTDFDIVERSAKVEKIAVWIKVSKEALADIKFLQSEINTELRELVQLKLDEQILKGDGTPPNLVGILDVAPTFAAVSTMALLVPTPNRFDVLMAAVAQIAAANFTADTAVVNPADFYAMQLVKDAEGRYLLPPFSTADGMMVAGLRIVANNGVTVGDFLVGDFKKDNLAIREDVNIQIGYVNDDFTKNLVTILAEMRAVNYIKTNHLNAFVQGTFSTAITALTKP